jgi:hypothetical protein
MAVVFTAMDGRWLRVGKKNQEKKGAMGVVEGCLGYWCRESNCHGVVASAFNRDHPNYVCWGCS